MTLPYSILSAAALGLSIIATASNADQLCNADGTGCMNVSWSCGSFTVPDNMMCRATIAVGSDALTQERLKPADALGGKAEADKAELGLKILAPAEIQPVEKSTK